MYPRALSTHSLCIRPFTYLESKNVIPSLISNLGLNKLGYNVFEDEVKEWANRVFVDYSYSDEVRRVMLQIILTQELFINRMPITSVYIRFV